MYVRGVAATTLDDIMAASGVSSSGSITISPTRTRLSGRSWTGSRIGCSRGSRNGWRIWTRCAGWSAGGTL